MKYPLLIVLFCSIIISSCAVLPIKYKKVDSNFNGFDESFKNPQIDDIRVLMVHGVGKQTLDWDGKFISSVLTISGKHAKYITDEVVRVNHSDPNDGFIHISQYKLGSKRITFYAVYWASITNDVKDWLQANHKENEGRRTVFNNSIKNIVFTKNLSDFVAYDSKYYSGKIKTATRQGFKYMYGIDPVIVGSTYISTLNTPPLPKKTAIYIVTGSLGTKVVFDVLNELPKPRNPSDTEEFLTSTSSVTEPSNILDTTTAKKEELLTSKEKKPVKRGNIRTEDSSKIEGRILHIKIDNIPIISFYAMSNQIPLLSLLDMLGPEPASLDKYNAEEEYYNRNTSELCEFMANYRQKELSLVSFYDPNDVLGYKMLDPLKDYNCDPNNKLYITNCTVANTVPFLGLFASPRRAHIGGWNNRKTIKLIVHGSHKK